MVRQPATPDRRQAPKLNNLDVVADVEKVAAADEAIIHLKAFDLPTQEKKLVIDTSGSSSDSVNSRSLTRQRLPEELKTNRRKK